MEDLLSQRNYESLIFEFRGLKVMVDADLAALYEVETKRLKEQVKRNRDRFPSDFMFELTKEEKDGLVAVCDRLSNLKHSSVNPLVFTEQGVAMLSSVLRSEKAIQINIEIMRAFTHYRSMLRSNEELSKRLDKVEGKLDRVFRHLLDRIEGLSEQKKKRNPIGFKRKDEKK